MLARRTPCLTGFMEQALFLGCVMDTYWGWHHADDGQELITPYWLCGPMPIYH